VPGERWRQRRPVIGNVHRRVEVPGTVLRPMFASDMPPRAIAKMVPLPVPRPAAVVKASTPKTAARVAMPRSGVGATFGRDQIGNTAKPKRPASTVTAQPMQAADPQGRGREPDPLGELLRGLFGNVREP
jgi:hypothetical protein